MIFTNCINNSNKNLALVYYPAMPYSADPMEYDYQGHHVVFRSTFSSLITQYKLGEYQGILAESWTNSDDYKTWEFKIRKNIFFENGDPITIRDIVLSFSRIAYLMKIEKSNSGLLELLNGFEKISSPQSLIEGISLKGKNILKLSFSQGIPKLLERISFGIYSIAHPNDYDANSGKWKDPKHFVASGAYKVTSWEKDSIKLTLRDNFLPNIGHRNKFKKIKIHTDKSQIKNSDLIPGKSYLNLTDLNKKFHGPVNSTISFIRCPSWNDNNSICNNLNNRITLRNHFYQALLNNGFNVTKSFFPLAMKNVNEITDQQLDNTIIQKGKKLRFIFYPKRAKGLEYFELIQKSMKETCKITNIKYEEVDSINFKEILNMIGTKNEYPFDLTIYNTGILVEDPETDIRFMFKSKQGIRLPDIDGSISIELDKKILNVQKINELLWKQAVIWPITHHSYGIWISPNVDIKILNTVLPPIDFFWVGHK